MEIKSLHTLNARGHMMLEVMRDYFDLTSQQMFSEIQGLRRSVENALSPKGICYEDLKTALVPDRKRREIALVFDTLSIDSYSYGIEVFKRLIPLFNKNSNHSVLCGDYSGSNENQSLLHEAMTEAILLNRSVEFKHSSQFFIVYINNLTPTMIERFDKGFSGWEPYIGYADTTYNSKFKFLLSTMLCNVFIKHKKIIIQGHEDDRPNNEDINMCGYPFEEFGYSCKSIQSMLEGVLLSYKIERPVVKGFEVDTEFSLNSVNSSPHPLDEFSIEVEKAKLAYLKKIKTGSMDRARLSEVSAKELSEIIKSKISASYIYNMVYDETHNVTKFNVIIELPSDQRNPMRLLAALEYQPELKTLRLITLY